MTVEDRQWHYQKGYEDGRADAIEEVLSLQRHGYKVYEHGEVETQEAIFVSDIKKIKEQK